MFIIFLTVKLSKSKRYCKDLTDLNVARFDQQFGTAPSKNPIVFVCLSAVCTLCTPPHGGLSRITPAILLLHQLTKRTDAGWDKNLNLSVKNIASVRL